MAKMTKCILKGKLVSVDEAIDLKESGRIEASDFRCTECKQPVRPHKSGGHITAHFEHLERNPDCTQSHVAR
jgi:hypothetical protein